MSDNRPDEAATTAEAEGIVDQQGAILEEIEEVESEGDEAPAPDET